MARKTHSTYAEHDIRHRSRVPFKRAADIGVDRSWFTTNTRDSAVEERWSAIITQGVASWKTEKIKGRINVAKAQTDKNPLNKTLTITANENHLGRHACWSEVIGEYRTTLMDFGQAVWSAIVRTVISKPGNGQWSEVTVIRQNFMPYFYRAATTPAVSPMRMCRCTVVVSRLCVERGNSVEIYKTTHDGHNTIQYHLLLILLSAETRFFICRSPRRQHIQSRCHRDIFTGNGKPTRVAFVVVAGRLTI